MPALAPPFTTERDGLVSYVAQQLDAFRAVSFGLTDEQARATPTPSTLSVGALIKHVTRSSRGWVERIEHAPEPPPADGRPAAERMAEYADDFVMREDETLDDVLARFDRQAGLTLRALHEADPDTPVPVPHDAPWFPRDVEHWSVRWVALHLVEELARHAGHADIIREAVDGATMYELVAGREGWPETDWLKPWRPPTPV
ncbi:DinB family protein [Nocardioides mesophilus]|uniref:DinB family protein n=1 Tax=Nocardioides mesophilus TaxID=433659 RepID=A0A7G9R8W5_9ACTN|nr:DinB family protein [Nocardioides mesophilus]QNN52040.1 DinB family protein [Nocardioides mesophilus]